MFCAILQPTVDAGVRKLSESVEKCSEMSGDSCVVTASGISSPRATCVSSGCAPIGIQITVAGLHG